MTAADYKVQITEMVKNDINQHIDKLKAESKDLHLTKQWNILFPKGFKPGNNVISIVTASKQGKYLVGELLFYLPDNLELDMESIELNLKNEVYNDNKTKPHAGLDEPLDVLNKIISGINDYILKLPTTTHRQFPGGLLNTQRGTIPPKSQGINNGIKVNGIYQTSGNNDIDQIRKQILQSSFLPEWFKTIESREIREQLLTKIAESLAHYQKQVGNNIDLPEFFNKYTEMLFKQDKLFHYCKYKSKPVDLDSTGICPETYCSKKPYNSKCNNTTLRFGVSN